MIRLNLSPLLLSCLAVPLGSGCGIEAGNPNSNPSKGGGKTGAISGLLNINLADAPIDNAQHVYLTLQTLSLIPLNADGTDGTAVSVPLANSGQIDALALHDGNTLELVAGQTLATGNYSSVVIGLNSATPASIVQDNGQESPLPLAGSANQIVVAQQFALSESQTLSLVLDLDLRRSITANSGNSGGTPFNFAPFANLNLAADQGQINGTVADTTLSEVCAYLFRQAPENNEGPLNYPGPPPNGGPPPGSRGGPPPQSVTAQPPPSFAPGQMFNPTSDGSGCSQAFATSSIASGTFNLNPLWPGQYQFVFYKADGTLATAQTQSQPISLAPGQTLQMTVPVSGALTTSP